MVSDGVFFWGIEGYICWVGNVFMVWFKFMIYSVICWERFLVKIGLKFGVYVVYWVSVFRGVIFIRFW